MLSGSTGGNASKHFADASLVGNSGKIFVGFCSFSVHFFCPTHSMGNFHGA